MSNKKNIKMEEELFFQVDSNNTPPDDVVSYNELRSASDLFRMHNKGILKIDPDFQRQIVWQNSDQTRFIDSLMKQLPIPSMCFSLDYKTQTWQVIDGLQRLNTIIKFLSEDDWLLSDVPDISKNISGKTVSQIKLSNPELYSRVENLTLPITVLRCDLSKENHSEYIFMIFHRLNTGGIKLNNQEIRNAIFQGPFNEFIKDLNNNNFWREINKIKKEDKKNRDRFKYIELILRFFAFFDGYNKYNGKLSLFLNQYMKDNRYEKKLESKKILFESTVDIIFNKIISEKPIERVSNVILEALMFGVGKNLNKLKNGNKEKISKCFQQMLDDESFRDENIREGISRKDKVLKRLKVSQKIFSEI